jgi:hypothetical protein
MTKRDESVFAKAFENMEAEGCFKELRAKSKLNAQTKPAVNAHSVIKAGKKPCRKAANSVSRGNTGKKVPLAAGMK